MTGYLYRYESHRYSICVSAEMELHESIARIALHRYEIVSKTPKGWWINIFGGRKWVGETRKRYAHPTTEEALTAYKFRKEAYIRHATKTLNRAKEELKLANSIRIEDGKDSQVW